MLQSKLETVMGIPEKYSPLNVIQKEMLVNSTPKLTQSEWVKEQCEDIHWFYNSVAQNWQVREMW